jgi:hypothetical protein
MLPLLTDGCLMVEASWKSLNDLFKIVERVSNFGFFMVGEICKLDFGPREFSPKLSRRLFSKLR